jgi:hypothetical protein
VEVAHVPGEASKVQAKLKAQEAAKKAQSKKK